MKRPRRARTVVIAIVAVVLLLAGSVNAVVQWRLSEARAGVGAVGQPSKPEVIVNKLDRDGRFAATAEYTSIAADDGAMVHTDFTWDDAWFFQDPTVYNQDLSVAAGVLSAVSISESEHYQRGSTSAPYMENLLAQLGFEEISTAYSQYRSEILDEVVNVFAPGKTDVTAYTVASKHITDPETGKRKLLVVAAVRGSYGSEWLSNLNMGFSNGLVAGMDLGKGDHSGFSTAAKEVADAILAHVDELGEKDADDGDLGNVSVLLCGHSRGAATASLAAAYLDNISHDWADDPDAGDEYSSWYIHHDSIYAYAFATPQVSASETCRDATYDNIFNVLNPADLVPRMPLAQWGFDRYGHDLWLPEPGYPDFDEKYAAYQADFEQDMGCASKYNPDDAEVVDGIEEKLSAQSPTIEDFKTPVGVGRALKTLLLDNDIVRILQAHAPNTYISWLKVTSASDLRPSR